MLSGGVAGVMIDVTLFPIDTLKVRAIAGLPLLPQPPTAVARDRRRRRARRPRRRLVLRRVRGSEAAPRRPRRPALRRALVRRRARRSGVLHRPRPVTHKMRSQAAHERARAPRSSPLAARRRPRAVRRLGADARARPAVWYAADASYEALRGALAVAARRRARRADAAISRARWRAARTDVRAALTTPLDVVRTRHVLTSEGGSSHFLRTAQKIVENLRARQSDDAPRAPPPRLARSSARPGSSAASHVGVQGLFRGILPRTAYMAFGGVVYLGSYSYVTDLVTRSSRTTM